MLNRSIELARARRDYAEIHVRPGIGRVERNGSVEVLFRFRTMSAGGLEPSKRCVIRRHIIECTKTLCPLILCAGQRFADRSGELNHTQHRQRLGRSDSHEPRLVCEVRRQHRWDAYVRDQAERSHGRDADPCVGIGSGTDQRVDDRGG